MTYQDMIYKVLWSSIEDFVGFWEIVWELNTLGVKESQDVAKKILKKMIGDELIKLYFAKWGTDVLVEIKREDYLEVIENNNSWEAPMIYQKCVKVGSTQKGEDCYKIWYLKQKVENGGNHQ